MRTAHFIFCILNTIGFVLSVITGSYFAAVINAIAVILNGMCLADPY